MNAVKKQNRIRRKVTLVDAVLPTQIMTLFVLPLTIPLVLQKFGVTYQDGQQLPLILPVFTEYGSRISDAVARSASTDFASYFSLARVVMYYLTTVFSVVDIVLCIVTSVEGDDLASSLERDVGRGAVWASLFIAPIMYVLTIIWGLFTTDALGISVREAAGQGVGNGVWWLYWPFGMSFGLGCLFLFIKSWRYLFRSSGEGA